MKRISSAGSFLPDRIKLAAKKAERGGEQDDAEKEGLSLLNNSEYHGHQDEEIGQQHEQGAEDVGWDNDLSAMTPTSRKKKLSILKNFRRKIQSPYNETPEISPKKEDFQFLPFALSLTTSKSATENTPANQDFVDKDDKEEEEVSRILEDSNAGSGDSLSQSLRQKFMKSISKRRLRSNNREEDGKKDTSSASEYAGVNSTNTGEQQDPQRVRNRRRATSLVRKQQRNSSVESIDSQGSPVFVPPPESKNERRRNRRRTPSLIQRKASVESEDSTIYSQPDHDCDMMVGRGVEAQDRDFFVKEATTLEMADSRSAWMEIAFEDLSRGSTTPISCTKKGEDDSQPSPIPQKTERTENTEPTGENSFSSSTHDVGEAADNNSRRTEGCFPLQNEKSSSRRSAKMVDKPLSVKMSAGIDPQTNGILPLREARTTSKDEKKLAPPDSPELEEKEGSKRKRNSARSLRRSQSVGTSPHSNGKRTVQSANNSPTKGPVGPARHQQEKRNSRSVSASRRSAHRLRDRTLRANGSSKSPGMRSRKPAVDGSSHISRSIRKSLPTINLDGDAPPVPTRSSSPGSVRSAGSSLRGARVNATKNGTEASPGRRRRKKPFPAGVGGDRTAPEDDRIQKQQQERSRSSSRSKSKRAVTSSQHSRASSTGSRSRRSKLRKSKSEKSSKKTKKQFTLPTSDSNLYGAMPECPSVGSASESASVFSDYMEASLTPKTDTTILVLSETPKPESLMGLDELLDMTKKLEEPVEDESAKKEGAHRRAVSDIPQTSVSTRTGKDRPGMGDKALSHRTLLTPGAPVGGRYVTLKEKVARHSTSKERKKLIDGSLDESLSRLSIADEGSVTSHGLGESVHSLFFDAMGDKD